MEGLPPYVCVRHPRYQPGYLFRYQRPNPDCNPNQNCHTNANQNRYANFDRDADLDCNTNQDIYTDLHKHTNTHSDADTLWHCLFSGCEFPERILERARSTRQRIDLGLDGE